MITISSKNNVKMTRFPWVRREENDTSVETTFVFNFCDNSVDIYDNDDIPIIFYRLVIAITKLCSKLSEGVNPPKNFRKFFLPN